MARRLGLSVVALLVMALAACGNGGAPDAAEIYADAGEAMATLTSYHVTGAVGSGLRGNVQDAGEAFGIEFDLMRPDSFQAAFTFGEGDELFELSVIGIGDVLYQQFSGFSSDWFIVPEEERAAFGDLVAFTSALTTEISDLTYVGEEDLDGVTTYRLEGTLAREVLELVEPEGPLPESVTVELWVGKEDSLVRRYVLSPLVPDETSTFTLARFDDESISIEAPANPRPADELEEFFAQLEGEPSFETPEDVKEAIEDLPAEAQECLRGVLGDAAYEELAAGTRLPTEAEDAAVGEACFAE